VAISNNEIELAKHERVFVLYYDNYYHPAVVEEIYRGYKKQNKPLTYVKCRFAHDSTQQRLDRSGRFLCESSDHEENDDTADIVISSGDDKTPQSSSKRPRVHSIQLVKAEMLRREDMVYVSAEKSDNFREAKISYNSLNDVSNLIYNCDTSDGNIE
jgi:hypothetical protein